MEEFELEDIIQEFSMPKSEPIPYNTFNESPQFNPYSTPSNTSPPYPPISIQEDLDSPQFIPLENFDSPLYAQNSPITNADSPPYAEESKYKEGDVVNYRGGGPTKYKIKKMTPHFATLDSVDPNTPPSEMVKVVKNTDLYDGPIMNPYVSDFQFQSQDPQMQVPHPLHSNTYGSTPNITLSPVIKIVNGDDKSTNIKDEGAVSSSSNEMQGPLSQGLHSSFQIGILKS
jgi:hypothetical protein